MRIVCPQCGYSREIPGDKVPSRSSIATCPKCQFRFRFRADLAPQRMEPVMVEEPVYPPRPSRPAPRQEPAGAGMETAMPVFSPRTARTYDPAGEQPPYRDARASHSTRSSARWLPDPEPESKSKTVAFVQDAAPPVFEPQPGGRQYRQSPDIRQHVSTEAHGPHVYEEEHDGPPYDDHGDGFPGEDQVSASAGQSELRQTPSRQAAAQWETGGRNPAGNDPIASLYADDLDQTARSAQAPPIGYEPDQGGAAPVAAPKVTFEPVPEPEAAPEPLPVPAPEPAEPDFWESSRLRPEDFSRLSGSRRGVSGSQGGTEDSLPPEFAIPAKAPSQNGQPGNPGSGDAALGDESPQPTEATAGNESVRDIWARLQTMGGKGSGPVRQAKESSQAPPRRDPPPGGETVAPWEQLEFYGVVPAFLNTLKNILLKPGEFFVGLPMSGGMVRPLIFAMVVSEIAALSCLVWNFFGLGPNFAELGRTEWFQGLGSGALGGLALLGLAPVLLVVFVLLDSALAHLLLGLLRGASRPFTDTFRTVCYSGGPWILAALPMPFAYLIPVVLIWHMTLQAIGLKKLHLAGYPQVLAAVLVKWSLFFMGSFAVLHMLFTRR